ncbi:hypothetical protein B0H14DRAFT_2564795 [Mycena olivaceomarginata]|nr:hypothetical protein B0H14DRAFT_2564795 [Mycena olivaceomarginata]
MQIRSLFKPSKLRETEINIRRSAASASFSAVSRLVRITFSRQPVAAESPLKDFSFSLTQVMGNKAFIATTSIWPIHAVLGQYWPNSGQIVDIGTDIGQILAGPFLRRAAAHFGYSYTGLLTPCQNLRENSSFTEENARFSAQLFFALLLWAEKKRLVNLGQLPLSYIKEVSDLRNPGKTPQNLGQTGRPKSLRRSAWPKVSPTRAWFWLKNFDSSELMFHGMSF